MEGSPPFSSKSPEDAAKVICLEGKRPSFKSRSNKSFPPELKEWVIHLIKEERHRIEFHKNGCCFSRLMLVVYPRLIEECWHSSPSVRPTFSQIIIRLDKIVMTCSKQGWWKDTFKLPWYAHTFFLFIRIIAQSKKRKHDKTGYPVCHYVTMFGCIVKLKIFY